MFGCCCLFYKNYGNKKLFQTQNESPELARGAAKAMYDLYEVVTHELLSPSLRYV